MYESDVHGTTAGKELSRTMVNKYVDRLVEAHSLTEISGVSLPASAAKQESDLQASMERAGVLSKITCVENNISTYMKTPFSRLPERVEYQYRSFEQEVLQEDRPPLDWFWFDCCGHPMTGAGVYEGSNMETFIIALGKLKPYGVAFFTACIWPTRTISMADQYWALTGKALADGVELEDLMVEYLRVLKAELGSNHQICLDIRYKSAKGRPFFLVGVAQGWKAPVHIQSLL